MNFYVDKKCYLCGKEFVYTDKVGWGYKKGEKLFCSWKCLRQYEKTSQSLNEKKEQIRELYHKGIPQKEIAQTLFMSVQSVNYWVTKIKDEEMTL